MDMSVQIRGGLVDLEYPNPRNPKAKVSKTVKFEDFCSIISSNIKKTEAIELMPIGLRVTAENDTHVLVGYEFPERIGSMKFNRGGDTPKEIQSVWPWGITFVQFKKDAKGLLFTHMYQFALKGPLVSLNDMLHTWPGSNVFDDARVCTGEMLIKHVPDIMSSGGFPHLFYNGISNNDLTGGCFKGFSEGGARIDKPYELFTHLAVKKDEAPKPFPYDILNQRITAKEFIKCHGFKDVK